MHDHCWLFYSSCPLFVPEWDVIPLFISVPFPQFDSHPWSQHWKTLIVGRRSYRNHHCVAHLNNSVKFRRISTLEWSPPELKTSLALPVLDRSRGNLLNNHPLSTNIQLSVPILWQHRPLYPCSWMWAWSWYMILIYSCFVWIVYRRHHEQSLPSFSSTQWTTRNHSEELRGTKISLMVLSKMQWYSSSKIGGPRDGMIPITTILILSVNLNSIRTLGFCQLNVTPSTLPVLSKLKNLRQEITVSVGAQCQTQRGVKPVLSSCSPSCS